jgi:hypothetical protein
MAQRINRPVLLNPRGDFHHNRAYIHFIIILTGGDSLAWGQQEKPDVDSVQILGLKSTTEGLSHTCYGPSGLVVAGGVPDVFLERIEHLRLADDKLSGFVQEAQSGPRRITDLELTDDTVGMSVFFGQAVRSRSLLRQEGRGQQRLGKPSCIRLKLEWLLDVEPLHRGEYQAQ